MKIGNKRTCFTAWCRMLRLPEVATRMNNPASCRLLPQLLLGQCPTVTKQLGSQSIVGGLEEGADLFLEETATSIAARRLRQRPVITAFGRRRAPG